MLHSIIKPISLRCVLQPYRQLSLSIPLYLNQKWRQEKGLPMNSNAYGVLTDGPDYTYLDGRPTPYGINQKRRIMEQKEVAQKIIDLTKEVDFAVERHKRLQEEEIQHRKQIIDSKLKPKGILLLKNK